MVRRRRSLSLTDTRSVLETTGEISIGAYAQQQRRRRLTIAAFGLGLIGMAAWLYASLRADEPLLGGDRHPVLVRCVNEDCQYQGTVSIVTGRTSFPVACPQCGDRSCYKVWECREPDCGYQFLLRSGPVELQCPFCGSRRVGAATIGADEPPIDPQAVGANGR